MKGFNLLLVETYLQLQKRMHKNHENLRTWCFCFYPLFSYQAYLTQTILVADQALMAQLNTKWKERGIPRLVFFIIYIISFPFVFRGSNRLFPISKERTHLYENYAWGLFWSWIQCCSLFYTTGAELMCLTAR